MSTQPPDERFRVGSDSPLRNRNPPGSGHWSNWTFLRAVSPLKMSESPSSGLTPSPYPGETVSLAVAEPMTL